MEEKPLGAHNTYVKDIKNGLKVQTKVAQKGFLEICLKKGLFTKDIIAIAKNIARGNDKKFKKEAKRILNDRINDKNREIRAARKEWDRTSRDCRLNHRL